MKSDRVSLSVRDQLAPLRTAPEGTVNKAHNTFHLDQKRHKLLRPPAANSTIDHKGPSCAKIGHEQVQQKKLFGHLVGGGKQHRRNVQTERALAVPRLRSDLRPQL